MTIEKVLVNATYVQPLSKSTCYKQCLFSQKKSITRLPLLVNTCARKINWSGGTSCLYSRGAISSLSWDTDYPDWGSQLLSFPLGRYEDSTTDETAEPSCHVLSIWLFINHIYFFLWRCGPTRATASSFIRFLDHTQRRTAVGKTPLDEWSARRRDLYLTTHNTHNRQTSMPPVGFEPTISAGKRPQTYALDRAATGTGGDDPNKGSKYIALTL